MLETVALCDFTHTPDQSRPAVRCRQLAVGKCTLCERDACSDHGGAWLQLKLLVDLPPEKVVLQQGPRPVAEAAYNNRIPFQIPLCMECADACRIKSFNDPLDVLDPVMRQEISEMLRGTLVLAFEKIRTAYAVAALRKAKP